MMNPDLYAELLVLWCKVSQKAHETLTNTRMPVRYELENGDVINELELDYFGAYFYIDGEDDPYEWDNFDEEVNQDLIEQTIIFIDKVSQISKLTRIV